MRERVNRLGVAESEITRLGNNQIQVGLPDVTNAREAIDQVGTTAQLFFFDWEPNVLGPGCKANPGDANVTGGPSAGSPGAGSVSHYDAVIRASKCPAKEFPNSSASGNQFFLVNDKAKTVVDGPGERPGDLRRPKAGERIVTVKPGATVVKAEQPDKGTVDQWFVLRDDPALKGTDIKNPEQNF